MNFELYLLSKSFFIVILKDSVDQLKVIENKPWFWGNVGLSFQRWCLGFNPLTMMTIPTLIWVRIPNIPIHFLSPTTLEGINNSLGLFLKVDVEKIQKGIITFSCICVCGDITKGLLDKILLTWRNKIFTQLIEYENTLFRCISFLESCHLKGNFPSLPT